MTPAVTLDMSKAQPLPNAAPVTLDMSKATPLPGQQTVSPWDAQQQDAHKYRVAALSGLLGMASPEMSDQDKASFDRGKLAGAISVPAVAAGTVVGTAAEASGMLLPIAKRYGIKALEGAGLGAGYELYKELKKVFEGNQ